MADVLSLASRRRDPLKCYGTDRVGNSPNSLIVSFNRAPSDDELRFLDDVMKRSACLFPPPEADTP